MTLYTCWECKAIETLLNYVVGLPTDQKEEYEDAKGVIRIRKSQEDRQHNGQKKKYQSTNNDLPNIHISSNTNNSGDKS